MRFSVYGQVMGRGVMLVELLDAQRESADFFARAERSSGEGCVVEVARWNEKNWRYERFARLHLHPGEYAAHAGESSTEVARSVAKKINEAGNVMDEDAWLIHRLPNWAGSNEG